MRLLIIRHGDPYYPTDSLTEKGIREAELLSQRLCLESIDSVYVSPLGRARMTAEPTLLKTGLKPVVCDWLQEFPVGVKKGFRTKYRTDDRCAWNMPPEMWTGIADIYHPEKWRDADLYKDSGIVERYDLVCSEFDALTAEHGYVKDGGLYRIKVGYENRRETLAFFCHMGLGNLLLAHIMGLSLPAVWHTLFLPTSSVTTIFMEKHFDDRPIAHARLISVGDTSHLFAGNEPVSPSGLCTDEIR